jgi:hypothetical protein
MDDLWHRLMIAIRPAFRKRRHALQANHDPEPLLVPSASNCGDFPDPPPHAGQHCPLCNNFVTEGVFEYGDQFERGVKEGLWQHPVHQIVASSEAGCSFCWCLIRAFELSDIDDFNFKSMRGYYAFRWRNIPKEVQEYENNPETKKFRDKMSTGALSVCFFAEKCGAIRVRDDLGFAHMSRIPWAVIYNPAGKIILSLKT